MAPRKARTVTTNTCPSPVNTGLILAGSVIDRTRRMVPADNPTIEIVTYTIQDDANTKYYVDDFSPNSYHELGEIISIPVYVKTYLSRNGKPSFNLNVQKKVTPKGEHF